MAAHRRGSMFDAGRCAVPNCPHHASNGEPHNDWFCRAHWRAIPSAKRRAWVRVSKLYPRTKGNDRVAARYRRLYGAIRRAGMEAGTRA